MPEYKLQVDGMMCEGCQETVTNTLKELAGVSSVNVDLEKKLATVQANDTFDIQGAAKKVTDAGYDTTVA